MDSEPENLIVPCNCTGSLTFVHTTCLQRWIDSRPILDADPDIESGSFSARGNTIGALFMPGGADARAVCEVCRVPYRLRHKYVFQFSWSRFLSTAGVGAFIDVAALSTFVCASLFYLLALIMGRSQSFSLPPNSTDPSHAFAFGSPVADAVIVGFGSFLLATLAFFAFPRALSRWRVTNSIVALAGREAHGLAAADGVPASDADAVALPLRGVSTATTGIGSAGAPGAGLSTHQLALRQESAERHRAARAREALEQARAQSDPAAAAAAGSGPGAKEVPIQALGRPRGTTAGKST
jgi:hypothetical protein